MRKNLLLTVLVFCFALVNLMAQNKITGTVTSANDQSVLPGVSVHLKGTTKGTITNSDGGYSIDVPNKGAILVFSFIGTITQEVAVGTRSTVNVALANDDTQLSEVVVTALGIEKKKNELGYATQNVDGAMIARTKDNNFINGLSGKVAGMEIRRNNTMGGSTNVVIRGAKSLLGNNQALFVVDGVPIDNSNNNNAGDRNQTNGRGGFDYGNAAADINPDDIAELTVLKGAASTALYGNRGANGVVMITTKKGSKNKGIGVTVNSGLTIGTVNKNTFVKYQNQYGQGYGTYYEDPSGFFLQRDIFGQTGALITPTSEDASYGGKFDATKMVYLWDAFDPASPYYGKPHPYVAATHTPLSFFKNSLMTNNSVSVDGTSDKGYFKLGYLHNDEKGILPNSKLSKDIINFGSSYALTKKLSVSTNVNISNVTGKGRYGTGYDDKNLAGNFRQWWATTTDIQDQKDAYFRNRKNVTWNWADPTDLSPIYWDNPYWTRYENYETDTRLRTFGNIQTDYKLASWVDLLGRVTFDSYNEQQDERVAVGSHAVSAYSKYNHSFKENNYFVSANFHKNFNNKISFRGLLGGNIQKTLNQSIFAKTNGGLIVPRLYSISNSVNPIGSPVETYTDLQINSVFASASATYDDFLSVDASIRRDEASSLPKGNNAYYYPAVSASFLFSKFIDAPWLTLGKIRGNIAQVGSPAPANVLVDLYDINTAYNGAISGSVGGTKNNGALKPELTHAKEVGLEMSMFRGRLGFDVTYYRTNTLNQIIPTQISTATGYSNKYINAGNIQNQGFEVSLYATPVKMNNFSWTINANWTRNRNKVIELAPGIDNIVLGSYQGNVTVNAAVGQPYGTIRGNDFIYNANGQKVIGSTGYYLKSTTSNEVIGNANPNWIGGINNTFRYKSVSLSFLIDIRNGGDVFSLDRYYGLATGESVETVGINDLGNPSRNSLANGGGYILPGVLADGTVNTKRVSNTNYGLLGYARNPAKAFVYNAGYIKLREVAISYGVPGTFVKRLYPIQSIDVSLIGRNLAILKKYLPEADPEDTMSSGNAQGYMGGSYPSTRNFGFNVKLRF